MIKLIASDMDGTLLDSSMQISPENAAAIKHATEQGVEFIVATGRNRTEALPALEQVGIECAMVTLNGAQVFDKTGQSLFTVPIDAQTVTSILDLLDERDIYYEVATDQGLFSQSQEQRIELFATHLGEVMPHLTHKMAIAMVASQLEILPIHYVKNVRQRLAEGLEVLKIICFHKEEARVLGPVAKELEGFGELSITSSGANNIEINHRDAQKGIAVAHLAHERNIPLEQIMTIGDNLNDISMIQMAGVSFAMGNAALEVKEYAKYVTDTNIEDGVGKAILRALRENL
ncbi:Cof-type HAD-IIB family hydrolase [Enterococcus asini]|uniref:Cof-type HAD-IIB family hydrolase n=1 Tax=Enterococcus asini TaxID=57732 RepID=UPI001E43A47A|nr:Cof-type HAD-IIB family hydrolase [Enterococcus asini]MCD5029811.1 HAD family phosphatase [Enterococcus asini]MDT2744431.1 Cof-type HAD-IIB family hydrolase [Enterococcus asini]MDT2763330.1 Cof-type HAD-IIB family hydrolase [Enterococcus asini]MDT2785060.1 Cof-type HAD-IIB family hydrolase [Enterococcus asini]